MFLQGGSNLQVSSAPTGNTRGLERACSRGAPDREMLKSASRLVTCVRERGGRATVGGVSPSRALCSRSCRRAERWSRARRWAASRHVRAAGSFRRSGGCSSGECACACPAEVPRRPPASVRLHGARLHARWGPAWKQMFCCWSLLKVV